MVDLLLIKIENKKQWIDSFKTLYKHFKLSSLYDDHEKIDNIMKYSIKFNIILSLCNREDVKIYENELAVLSKDTHIENIYICRDTDDLLDMFNNVEFLQESIKMGLF